MNYRQLFSIELQHPGFTPGEARALTLQPDGATRRILQGPFYLLKPTAKGLTVLQALDENGNPLATPDTVWNFGIYSRDHVFTTITDNSDLSEGEIRSFSNATLAAPSTDLGSSGVSAPTAHKHSRMVAQVAIHPITALLNSASPLNYVASFQVKSEKWHYYFVADADTTDLQVINANGGPGFVKKTAGADPADTVGISLQSRFPGANVFLFESETPIAKNQKVIRNLQLHRDGQVLIRHLPNPEIGKEAVQIIKVQKLISNQ